MLKTTEELYQEHLDEMFAPDPKFSNEDVERILDRILQCLPNEGKLYKYRSIEGKAFDNAFDSLKNGYLWLPKAEDLNDDEDTTLFYDPLKSAEEIKDYLFAHPYEFMSVVVSAPERKFKLGKTKRDELIVKRACDCYDKATGELDKRKAVLEMVKDGIPKETAIEQLNKVESFIESYLQNNKKAVETLVDKHMKYNDNIRSLAYVYSMSEDFDCNQMWAYYANSNNGFCIEYDFNKSKELPVEIKRKLINLYRVKYVESVEEFSFEPLLEWFLCGQDERIYNEENKRILNYLITKKIGWQHEKEWRLFMTDIDNKLFADIVSGIIIDERAIHSENGSKLIALAKERAWKIKVRRTSITKTKHLYENWSE